MVDKRGAYKVLVRKPEEKKELGRPKRRWENNIKMDIHKRGWGGLDLFAQVRDTNVSIS
jgi:hypothetical protein